MVLYNLVWDHCPDIHAKSGARHFKNIGVIPILVLFGFCMVWFRYILVWFGMVLHHLAFDDWPDVLPCQI